MTFYEIIGAPSFHRFLFVSPLIKKISSFLAYFQFLKSAIVLTILSVWCIHGVAPLLPGVNRSCSFMTQSIAYDPWTSTKKDFFLEPVLDHAVRL
jgi:hypothetical protein